MKIRQCIQVVVKHAEINARVRGELANAQAAHASLRKQFMARLNQQLVNIARRTNHDCP